MWYSNGGTTVPSPDIVRWEAKYIAECLFPVSGYLFFHYTLFSFTSTSRSDWIFWLWVRNSTHAQHIKFIVRTKGKNNKQETNIYNFYTYWYRFSLKCQTYFSFEDTKKITKEFWENFIRHFSCYFDICHTHTLEHKHSIFRWKRKKKKKKQSAHDQPENKLNSIVWSDNCDKRLIILEKCIHFFFVCFISCLTHTKTQTQKPKIPCNWLQANQHELSSNEQEEWELHCKILWFYLIPSTDTIFNIQHPNGIKNEWKPNMNITKRPTMKKKQRNEKL